MKKILFLSICVFYLLQANSQTIYFNKRYDFKDTSIYHNIELANGIALHSKGYIVVGNSLKFDQGKGGRISLPLATLIIDTNGNLLGSKTFGNSKVDHYPAQSGPILRQNDSNYFFLANIIDSAKVYSILVNLDINGDTLWSKIYTDTINYQGYLASNMVQAENKSVVLALQARVSNTTGDGRTRLVKVDSVGNIIWNTGIASSWGSRPYCIDISPDNGFLVGGIKRSTLSIGSDVDAWVFKTDSTGSLLWERTFGGGYSDQPAMCASTSDGGVVCGYVHALYQTHRLYGGIIEVFKLDSTGNTVWHKEISDSSTKTAPAFLGIKEMEDSSLVAVIDWLDSSGSRTGSLYKMSPNGDSLWHRIYKIAPHGRSSQNYLRDFQPTEDGGYVAVGFVFPVPPDTGDQDMWVVKVDSFGCLVPGCHLITSLKEVENMTYLSTYPNPANNVLNVYFKTESKPQKVQFNLLDMQGRLQKEWQSYSNDISYILPVNDLKTGMYILHVLFDGKVMAKEKVVVAR